MPTGFGGGGLATVNTNASLTGSGTGGSPLGVTGWPLTFYTTPSNSAAQTALVGANAVFISGFVTSSSLTVTNIVVNVKTIDAVNLYDLGVYNTAGTLLFHIGAQSLPSSGLRSFAVSGGAKALPAGMYAFAWTGNSTTANLAQDSGPAIIWIQNNNVATSASGVLPASIGALTVAVGIFALEFAFT